MAAVAIPVAIHLWNVRPGKVLKIGSIALMQAASRKTSRSLKLVDIPLLCLRCLLLIILAMLLAIPLWQKRLDAAKSKGWIIVPKENLQYAYSKFKPTIDSLTGEGYEFHYFNTGFPKAELKQALAASQTDATNIILPNYWGLIAQLDTAVSPTLPVYLFTPGRSTYFTGNRPSVTLNLHWQTYIPADSTSKWIQSASFTDHNTIKVVQGSSNPSAITYTTADIKNGDEQNSPYHVAVDKGSATVSFKAGDQEAIQVDTSSLSIAIYADHTKDAEYLKAALQAVTRFMQRKAIIKQYTDAHTIPKNQNWVFWLSEKSVDDKLTQGSQNIFSYQKGHIINSDSWLSNTSVYNTSLQQGKTIALYKQIDPVPTAYTPVWRDGFGNAILSVQRSGKTNNYKFYSRFDPTWNDLVWSDEFPEWMMDLLVGSPASPNTKYDKRVMDKQQFYPVINNHSVATMVKTNGFSNLSNYFWLLLVLLFVAERWMVNKTQKIAANG